MNKNLLKKIIFILFLTAPILALIITFCNTLSTALSNTPNLFVTRAEPEVAAPIGDRGSSHLPGVGFSLPEDTWFLVLIICLAIASLVGIILLAILKIKTNKKIEEQNKQKLQEQQSSQEVKKSASLKEIVAKNLENDNKEYKKIDNPKHDE